MDKVLLSLALIISGLTLGYIFQNLDRNKKISLSIQIADLRKMLEKMRLLFFMPISFLGAVWIVSFENVRVVLLPVVGLCSLLFGGILGLVFASLLRKPNKDKAVLYCCGSFSNIGSVGSLVCFFFFGEAGFALAALALFSAFFSSIALVVTGLIKSYKNLGAIVFDPIFLQWTAFIHTGTGMFFMVLFLAHVAALLLKQHRLLIPSMFNGKINAEYALSHHSKWQP